MNLKGGIILTKEYIETEILDLALEEGLTNGEEVLTAFYQKKGYINSGKSLNAFIEKLKQGYETVELKLNPKSNKGKGDRPYAGKKRVYIVGNKRKVFVPRKLKYSAQGQPLSTNGKILFESIKQQINSGTVDTTEGTIATWLDRLNFPFMQMNLKSPQSTHMRKQLQPLALCKNDFYNEQVILQEFILHYNYYSNAVLKRFFKKFKEEKIFNLKIRCYGKVQGEGKSITSELYKKFTEREQELLKVHGLSRYEYNRIFALSQFQDKVRSSKIILQIQEELFKEFNFLYVYQTFEIQDVSKSIPIKDRSLTKKYMKKLYDNYFLEVVYKYRYKNYEEHYRKSTYFYRAFYYLTATLILEQPNGNLLQRFEQDLKTFIRRHDSYYRCVLEGYFKEKKKEALTFSELRRRVKWSDKKRKQFYHNRYNKVEGINYDF